MDYLDDSNRLIGITDNQELIKYHGPSGAAV